MNETKREGGPVSTVVQEMKTDMVPVSHVREQMNQIKALMKDVMIAGEDYGVIPGTEKKDKEGRDISKPTLLQPGAQKLNAMFHFYPDYEITREFDGHHLSIMTKCTLRSIETGKTVGVGMGSCTTKESKFAWRKGARKCPVCGKEAIIVGKEEFGGGFVCFDKKGGCRAKFTETEPKIIEQKVGRVPNEDIADQYNTVLKMSNKRGLVAATINATAAASLFTQDMEDFVGIVDTTATTAAAPPISTTVDTAKTSSPAPSALEKLGKSGTTVFIPKDIKQMKISAGVKSGQLFVLLFNPDGIPFELSGDDIKVGLEARTEGLEVSVSYKYGKCPVSEETGFYATALAIIEGHGKE